MSFTPRTNEVGIWDNPYAYDLTYNAGATNYIWLPNCTTYAYFRSVEISGGQVTANTIFGDGFSNAKDWYNDALWEKSPNYTDIRLGDIVVWGAGGGVGKYGHVAVVEAIDSEYVYTSNSHYNFNGQTKGYPATDSKRYFEYARHPKNMTTYTRLYHYNQNGIYGGDYTYWTCPNFIGCIHNPYADQEPPAPDDPTNLIILTILCKRKKAVEEVII